MEIFKESDLKEFRNNEFAVHCETEELSKEFLGLCYDEDMTLMCRSADDTCWGMYKDETCYNFEDGYLLYSDKSEYLENGYTIKEFKGFKGFNNSEDENIFEFEFECEVPIYKNRMPTLLEYFMQIHELEEGEEFVVNGEGRHRIVNGETESFEYDNKWRRSFISATDLNLLEISKAEWKPKQNEEYYYINFYSDELICTSSWNSSRIEERLFERGLIHKTKEEAEKRLEEIIALNRQ